MTKSTCSIYRYLVIIISSRIVRESGSNITKKINLFSFKFDVCSNLEMSKLNKIKLNELIILVIFDFDFCINCKFSYYTEIQISKFLQKYSLFDLIFLKKYGLFSILAKIRKSRKSERGNTVSKVELFSNRYTIHILI